MSRLLVVGGGAAGIFAAIRAREVNPRLEVMVIEATARPLGKVRISGGGRCNVTHACFDVDRLVEAYPRGGRALRGLFRRFGPRETVDWFGARGVRLKTESDGRMFPATDDASTIVDALLRRAQQVGVRLAVGRTVKRVTRAGKGFQVDDLEADRVILATGGGRSGFDLAAGCGLEVVPPVPSLFTFKVEDPRLEGLAGMSVAHVRGTLEGEGRPPITQEGPLLVTHWGLSGPVVLRLSAWGARFLHETAYRARLRLDLLPDLSHDEVRQCLQDRKARGDRKHVGNEPALPLSRRLWQRLLDACAIPHDRAWTEAPGAGLNRLAEMGKRAVFDIKGKGPFKEEFVTAGGVALATLDLATMECRDQSGLYCVGELIDVDAVTGGFNFQNAWSTGWVAGEAAAKGR